MNINYMLKVEDAKLTDIQKALTQAGIKVRSIIEVFKEGTQGTAATITSPSTEEKK
ncbi:MAG: hypothetical protein ACK4TF_09265 [Thermodesulfovibrionales bacterium]